MDGVRLVALCYIGSTARADNRGPDVNFRRSTSAEPIRDFLGLAVLMSTSCLMALIFTVPAPLLYLVGEEYGAWVAQGISSLPSLGIVIGGPVAAWLSHKVSTRQLLLPALAVYGALGPLALFIHSAALLLASRFMLGFAAAIAVSASISLLSQRYDGAKRLKALGLQGGIASIAGLATLWLSGGIASGGDWRSSFVLYALALMLLIVALPTLRNGTGANKAARRQGGPQTVWPMIKSLWALYTVVILLFAASFSTGLQLSFKLGDNGIVNPLQQRNVILFGSLMNALSSMSFGFVAERMGAQRIFLVALALMTAGALTIGQGHTPLVVGTGSALMGTGSGIIGPYLIGLLTTRIAESERAGAVGVFYSCIFIGEFLNPLFMQPLRQAIGSDGAFITLSVFLALISVVASRILAGDRQRPVGPA